MTSASAEVLSFLAARAIPHVEEARPSGLRRSFTFDGTTGVIDVSVTDSDVRVSCDEGNALEAAATETTSRVFDVGGDSTAAVALLERDPKLRPFVTAKPDMRIPGVFDATEGAVRAVVGQQVSVAGARTLVGRIAERAGTPLEHPIGAVTHAFPTAQAIASAELAGVGMPGARVRAVRSVAAAIADGAIHLSERGSSVDTFDQLLELPGIGPWTASYICMRVLGDRDAFLPSDLGVRKGAAAAGLPTEAKELIAHAERWRPFRAYAVMYLWLASSL